MQTHEHPHTRTLDGGECHSRRSHLKLSRSALAREALVDRTSVYRLETGEPVSDLTRRRIAAALERAEMESA